MQRGLTDARIDLTVDQWVVLDHLSQNCGISQIELGNITFKDPPTMTRILDLLVKKNLVTRLSSSADRRKFTIDLTEKGREVHKKANEIITQARRQAWNSLDEDDYNTLVKIMDTIYSNMG
ncbi:MarR family winged helix-turn-helix transcriptional regulator [Leadbetterella sp. DM7]|uniref:MarR family winged helix-turn-helix transcriptional regulator n=1 Tax=Leadbetterella sp. DM7 TaxID=3235085 RepID=UPI00349E7DC1